MPECQNCGGHVTRRYARVFTPDGVENPRVCPDCEDKIRDGADVRNIRT
jgi:NAD-dependent SIR2 family protein deacetylase